MRRYCHIWCAMFRIQYTWDSCLINVKRWRYSFQMQHSDVSSCCQIVKYIFWCVHICQCFSSPLALYKNFNWIQTQWSKWITRVSGLYVVFVFSCIFAVVLFFVNLHFCGYNSYKKRFLSGTTLMVMGLYRDHVSFRVNRSTKGLDCTENVEI